MSETLYRLKPLDFATKSSRKGVHQWVSESVVGPIAISFFSQMYWINFDWFEVAKIPHRSLKIAKLAAERLVRERVGEFMEPVTTTGG